MLILETLRDCLGIVVYIKAWGLHHLSLLWYSPRTPALVILTPIFSSHYAIHQHNLQFPFCPSIPFPLSLLLSRPASSTFPFSALETTSPSTQIPDTSTMSTTQLLDCPCRISITQLHYPCLPCTWIPLAYKVYTCPGASGMPCPPHPWSFHPYTPNHTPTAWNSCYQAILSQTKGRALQVQSKPMEQLFTTPSLPHYRNQYYHNHQLPSLSPSLSYISRGGLGKEGPPHNHHTTTATAHSTTGAASATTHHPLALSPLSPQAPCTYHPPLWQLIRESAYPDYLSPLGIFHLGLWMPEHPPQPNHLTSAPDWTG